VRYLHDKLKSAGFDGMKDFMQHLNGASAPTMDQALQHFFGSGYDQAAFLAEIQADSGDGRSNGVVFVQTRMNLTNADTGASAAWMPTAARSSRRRPSIADVPTFVRRRRARGLRRDLGADRDRHAADPLGVDADRRERRPDARGRPRRRQREGARHRQRSTSPAARSPRRARYCGSTPRSTT
jgi:hypothetical protein